MRTVVLTLLLLGANTAGLRAQAIPLVTRMPMDTVKAGEVIGPRKIIRDSHAVSLPASLIVDSLLLGISPADSGNVGSPSVFWPAIATLTPDSIETLRVYKGAAAIERGACPGTPLVVITTKSGKWRPAAGVITGKRACTPERS